MKPVSRSNENKPAKASKLGVRTPLVDITNSLDLRSELHNEISPPAARANGFPRRGHSYLGVKTTAITETKENLPVASGAVSHEARPGFQRSSLRNFESTATTGARLSMAAQHRSHPIALATRYQEESASDSGSSVSHLQPRPSLRALLSPTDPHRSQPTLASNTVLIPVSTTSDPATRTAFTTTQLPPKTHKTASGQVVILPSHGVLVDFREGERRNGRKGNEVITVSPDGTQIQVFSAPHLSTPCCLAEPTAAYTLSALPSNHCRLYDQASKVIEHAKSKIPNLVMHRRSATCTLMANEPRGDIELVIPPHSKGIVKIRFSRKRRTIEISTFGSSSDWSKKVMFCSPAGVLDDRDSAALSQREIEGMTAMLEFLRIVDAVEAVAPDALRRAVLCDDPTTRSTEPAATSAVPKPKPKPKPGSNTASLTSSFAQLDLTDVANKGARNVTPHAESLSPSTSAFCDVNIAPRPKLTPSSTARAVSDPIRRVSSTVFDPATAPESRPQSAVSMLPSDARFIAGVGWCMRDMGGRFRIMFFDGVVLEVDVEDERIEFVGQDGKVVRLSVRDCHAQRVVGERMKAFEKFVSLFDV